MKTMKLSDDIDEFNAAMQAKYGRYYILATLTPGERKHALQLAEQVRGGKSHIPDGSDETAIDRWRAVKQVNALNGWIKIDAAEGDTYIMRSQTMAPDRDMELTEQEIEMRYEDMQALRDIIWDAIRKKGRGFAFSVDDIMKIEEVRHKGRYSVEGYKEEINWTIDLLQRHLTRIEHWQDDRNCGEAGDAYGKLDEFLSELEE
jgi:hypothetical protein